MKKIAGRIVWALISLAAAFFLAAIAVDRGEPVNSFWIVLAAACTYLVGFRFYAQIHRCQGDGAGRSARHSGRAPARWARL